MLGLSSDCEGRQSIWWGPLEINLQSLKDAIPRFLSFKAKQVWAHFAPPSCFLGKKSNHSFFVSKNWGAKDLGQLPQSILLSIWQWTDAESKSENVFRGVLGTLSHLNRQYDEVTSIVISLWESPRFQLKSILCVIRFRINIYTMHCIGTQAGWVWIQACFPIFWFFSTNAVLCIANCPKPVQAAPRSNLITGRARPSFYWNQIINGVFSRGWITSLLIFNKSLL